MQAEVVVAEKALAYKKIKQELCYKQEIRLSASTQK
jgi:hypothetical protein